MPLFKKLPSLALVDRKLSPEKWLKEIQGTARGLLPVSTADDERIAFPWAQLRLHTDVFLSKRELSETERDSTLCRLIASAPNQIVALAACSRHLSSKALFELLATFQLQYPGDIPQFLQAFIAASHSNTEVFPPADEAWATMLISVVHLSSQHAIVDPVPAMRLLINKWCNSDLPQYLFLRDVVRLVTVKYFQKINAILEECIVTKDWSRALKLSDCLMDIRSRPNGLPQILQDMLDWEISQWRHWTVWKPDQQKLSVWQRYSDTFPIQAFWTALGPDLESSALGVFPTAMARVIASGQMIHWMETNGLKPGFDIMVCDSIEATIFSTRLMTVLHSSCELGGVAFEFLQFLASDDQGLDRHSLELWEDAQISLCKLAPDFLSALLRPPDQQDEIIDALADDVFDKGITSLSPASLGSLRAFLNPSICRVLRRTTRMLLFNFTEAVQWTLSWLPAAQRLIQFANMLIKQDWARELVAEEWPGIERLVICSIDSLQALQQLHKDVCEKNTGANLHIRVDFNAAITTYITNTILAEEEAQDDRQKLVAELHQTWNSPLLSEHRAVALLLIGLEDIPLSHRTDLVGGINILTVSQLRKLESCLMYITEVDMAQHSYTVVMIAARVLTTYAATGEAWSSLVRHVMGSYSWLPPDDDHFTKRSFKKYRKWISHYATVFDTNQRAAKCLEWVRRLDVFRGEVESIRSMDDSHKAVHSIYTASDEPFATQVIEMLDAMKQNQDPERDELMRHCVLSLADTVKHAAAVSQAVGAMSTVGNSGFQRCKQLTILAAQESVYVAAVQKEVWLGMDTDLKTRKALDCLAAALRLPTNAKAELAKDYFMQRLASVMKEARMVEDMRMKLNRHDRKGVTAVLTSLKIEENSSALEEEILDLPSDLLSVIEQVDPQTAELHFSLTYMNATQRKAWGISNGESVTVRVEIGDNGSRDAFCAHVVAPQDDSMSVKHDPLKHRTTTTAPDTLRCEGRVTRLTYLIMRCMWYWLRRDDGIPLADLYNKIDNLIRTGQNKCIVCNHDHPTPAKTYRPSVCIKSGCRAAWLRSAREIRLVDLRLDPGIVELLLVAIHAAVRTMSTRKIDGTEMDLLPDRPPRLLDDAKLLTLLESIPKISTAFNTVNSLYSIQSNYSIRAELLLSWATNNFRGFLMSAPPALQIPNMPGARQFVLADSPPEIVAAFAQHDALQPRQVLFHGTTMDRLYAILCQGLKILSHTSLQTHGAAYGTGIYLAEAPATALSYSAASNCPSADFALKHQNCVNRKVLLGIEYAGNDVSRGNGIHVATDPTKVLLRYVFLLPPSFRAPIATHVVPALQSNFYTLKSGARAT